MRKPAYKKIDILLQYILAVAGQEDWESREMGPIHLIKYLYLVDLAYAEFTGGETYTGLPWKFYHFGPWVAESYERIEPALSAIGATKKIISNQKNEYDMIRWSITSDRLCNKLEKMFHFVITGAVQRFVHKFGSDTASLLDFVYRTWPMLKARPGEMLDFTRQEYSIKKTDKVTPEKPLTARQQKKRKASIEAVKKSLRKKMDEKKKKRRKKIRPAAPIYDEIFFEGVKTLDSLAGKPIGHMEGIAVFHDSIWKSKARFDPDVS